LFTFGALTLSFGITKSTWLVIILLQQSPKVFLKIFGGLLANPGNVTGGCKMGVWLLAAAFGALMQSVES